MMKTIHKVFIAILLTVFTAPAMAQNDSVNNDMSNSENGAGTHVNYRPKPITTRQDDSIAYRYSNGSHNGTNGANSAFTFTTRAAAGEEGAALRNTKAFGAGAGSNSGNAAGMGVASRPATSVPVNYQGSGVTSTVVRNGNNNASAATGIGNATPSGGNLVPESGSMSGTGDPAHGGGCWWGWFGLLGLLGLFGLRARGTTNA